MKSFGKIVTAVAIGLLAATSAATAQTNAPFDAKKFFEELQQKGAKMPPAFDAQKFFDEIQQKGGQSSSFDAKKFFEELQNRGAQMPPSFDPQKFFEEIQQKGGQLPPMVKVK